MSLLENTEERRENAGKHPRNPGLSITLLSMHCRMNRNGSTRIAGNRHFFPFSLQSHVFRSHLFRPSCFIVLKYFGVSVTSDWLTCVNVYFLSLFIGSFMTKNDTGS